ncbi:MAG: hypothetical protein IPM48_01920 [Saprospiraceae bacterium]|nr:hypothetical protein [Saprospiraceae bacterium]
MSEELALNAKIRIFYSNPFGADLHFTVTEISEVACIFRYFSSELNANDHSEKMSFQLMNSL